MGAPADQEALTETQIAEAIELGRLSDAG